MDPNKLEVTHLESLPQDLLGIIVSKVGATDPESYTKCVLACRELGASARDERVCKTLNLAPLVRRPIAAIKYQKVMKRCLENDNPDANYIQGILRYFLDDLPIVGQYFLSMAADAGHKEATNLYAMLLLCNGKFEEGKNYLDKLKWVEDNTVLDICWDNIKISFLFIKVERKKCYIDSLRKMKPHNLCQPIEIANHCRHCMLYPKMFKFVF